MKTNLDKSTLHSNGVDLVSLLTGRETEVSNLVTDHLSDAIILTDPKFIIESCNKAATKQYGISSAKMKGKSFPQLIVQDYLHTSFEKVRRQLIETGHWQGKANFTSTDGEKVHFDSILLAMKNEQLEITGFTIINKPVIDQHNTNL